MVGRKDHIVEDGIEKRWCGKCKKYSPLERFGRSSSTWDGLRSTCKDCLHEQNVANKDRITEYNKNYWQKTMEIQKEKSKQWRNENKDRARENMQRWLTENSEYKKQKDKEYREAHKEEYKENHRRWRKENYEKMKEENGPEFIKHKLKTNIGRRIREILGQNKSERCMDYVGCSLENLKAHLESTFKDDMSWENYGKWQIDHKIPCAAFDMGDPIEQKACWHYTNLQALWAIDNILKKDKFCEKEKMNYMEKFLTPIPQEN